MTGIAFLLLVVAIAVAIGDWLAVAHHNRLVEYLCKPLTMLCLFGVASTIDPADPTVRTWFAVALFFSLVGDVFLMVERDLFVVGLGAFLVAHLAYIGGFLAAGVGGIGLLVGLVLVAVTIFALGAPIVRGTRASEPDLVVPLVAYMAVISTMLVVALGAADARAIVGAVLFYASDAMIGWSRFVRPAAFPQAIIVTYHLGQIALTVSLI